ncbi:MAG: hypothetical protein Kow0010_13690 [Dehalococcoidia bacterium]
MYERVLVPIDESGRSRAVLPVQEAESERVSLMCMATRGRVALGRMLFGSVADEVLRNAPDPVLLVRAE